MEHRQMRRKDKEVTSREWMFSVLRRGLYAEIALAGTDGAPYVLPMSYGFDDGHLFIHGAMAGMKIDLLRQNPRVCFNILAKAELYRNPDDPSNVSFEFESVTGFGTARFVEDTEEKLAATRLLMEHYGAPMNARLEAKLKATCVIAIDIEEMTGKQSVSPKNPPTV